MALRLEIEHVTKRYNGNNVLKDCSFSFEAGQVYALMGPNGSGKSTLLRICALLESPDSGRTEYFSGNEKVPFTLNLKRQITLFLPDVGIFNTSVFKNVAYGLRIRGFAKREIEEKVNAMLKVVGLEHKRDENGLLLSSGQKKRLGIARAMVIEPGVLFLDEPTASIDQENSEIIESIIQRMKYEGKTTIIITTHDETQAARLAHTTLFLQNGVVYTTGS